MELVSRVVGLERCPAYERRRLKQAVDTLCRVLGFRVARGSRVLLKPNLISARRRDGLACTHPEFVAAAAEWFLDQGARVGVGDSPALGTAKKVMAACGITAALQGLPVKEVNFTNPRRVSLENGFRTGVAAAVLECDLLVNLPKVKAHGQLLMSLAVKNYFGSVVGFRKPWIHALYGDVENRFESLLIDLLHVLPGGISLMDGVVAMHREGPVNGDPYPLGGVAASENPVALDTALLRLLGVDHAASPLWREAKQRGLPGCDPEALSYPRLGPAAFSSPGFLVPHRLKPVSFHPWRLVKSGLKRTWHRYAPS